MPEEMGARPGQAGAGGYHAVWKGGTVDAAVAEHISFQYGGIAHQAETALSGMWLFLTTEMVFFGGLFLIYTIYRVKHPVGFAVASLHTEHTIGIANTVLLLTSSATLAYGLGRARLGDNRRLFWAVVATGALGSAFLLLKAWEWTGDIEKGLFPGPGFAITGDHGGAAQLFWSYYFIGTGLHGVHMLFGLGLLLWIALAARRGRYSPDYHTPVETVGLYWSFVDMVWLLLFPTIYLVGGVGS